MKIFGQNWCEIRDYCTITAARADSVSYHPCAGIFSRLEKLLFIVTSKENRRLSDSETQRKKICWVGKPPTQPTFGIQRKLAQHGLRDYETQPTHMFLNCP
jgi:hypothetical protein